MTIVSVYDNTCNRIKDKDVNILIVICLSLNLLKSNQGR